MKIDKSNKYLMSVLLIIPMILLIIGVYGGLMQTFFQAGIVQSDPFMGPDYYKGLTMHGVLNAIFLRHFLPLLLEMQLFHMH